ncbi:MAG: phosphoribosylglycinamide formyltransferase [Rikenellaceae bacterium]
MKNIAIFASGAGSNAENIITSFSDFKSIKVSLILCNNLSAGVIERAKRLNVPCVVFNRDEFKNGRVEEILKNYKIDFIVLAGFLWLVPKSIISLYEKKIINIHPALLPKYGGKGMYGDRVHEAVYEAKEKQSGITIHYVNENFDDGDIIFQATVLISDTDTANDIANKVHALEYKYFPEIIANTIL